MMVVLDGSFEIDLPKPERTFAFDPMSVGAA
jgi:hypothetical protein